MRARIVVALAAALVGMPAVGQSQEAEALRRELEQMRQRLETMTREYQAVIETLSERLQRLEAAPRPEAAPPAVVQPPPDQTPRVPGLVDLARRREPFSLYDRRGAGQFLFDLGVVGDFVGSITQRAVERADAGTFTGRENRFFPREVELVLFGQIDPYARGEIRLEAAEEFEDGERELHVGLAEANLTLLALPWGTQAKLGLMRTRVGMLNERHREALPQIDQPAVLTRFLGEEGLRESGLEATWLPPLPFYLEVLGGVFNGDNEESFGGGSLRDPLLTGRVRTFWELGATSAVQLGASVASGENEDGRRTTLVGADVKYKLTPEGWQHSLLTVAGEALYSSRRLQMEDEATGISSSVRRDRYGWYAYAEIQPWRRWLFGARYDWTEFPVDPGREWAVEPYIAFMPSEFLRFRLAYKHTERSREIGGEEEGSRGRIVDELLLQATFFLGAHPAHPF